jgi:hypothetical protein
VLQVGAETFRGEGGPDWKRPSAKDHTRIPPTLMHTQVLRHGIRLESKRIELVSVDGKLLLDVLEGVVVDEKEDLSLSALAMHIYVF